MTEPYQYTCVSQDLKVCKWHSSSYNIIHSMLSECDYLGISLYTRAVKGYNALAIELLGLACIRGLPESAEFSRRTIFADWHFRKICGNNFRGPRILLASILLIINFY